MNFSQFGAFSAKVGGYILFYWKQLFIYYLLRWCVQCTHYTPEEQTEQSFPSYKIFTKHKSIFDNSTIDRESKIFWKIT